MVRRARRAYRYGRQPLISRNGWVDYTPTSAIVIEKRTPSARPNAVMMLARFSADGLAFGPSMRMRPGGDARALLDGLKAYGRFDVILQYGFADREIAVENAFEAFTEESLWEVGVHLRAGPNRFLEIVCQWHQ